MAWTTTLVTFLRVIIGDVDNVSYTDTQLQTILAVGAKDVNAEIDWPTTYTINISTPDISPDPTLAATLDVKFGLMIVLKSACLLNLGELRTAAIKGGIEARYGSAVLKTGKHSGVFKQLIKIGPCAMYEKLHKQCKFEAFNTNSAFGVLSPFVNDETGPGTGSGTSSSVTEYYVATTGNDGTGDGSKALPWLTHNKAKTVVAADIAAGLTKNIRVLFRGGTYRYTATEVFNTDDYDSVYSVTYEGYPGETAILNGSKILSGRWVNESGDIWSLDLSNLNQAVFHQLTINGTLATRARWPKFGTYHIMEEFRDLNTHSGSHTGGPDAPDLEDTGQAWPTGSDPQGSNNLIGRYVTNTTKATFGRITANTATTVTSTIATDWDANNDYTIEDDLPTDTAAFTSNFYDYFRWDQAGVMPDGSVGNPTVGLDIDNNPAIEVITYSDFVENRHRLKAIKASPDILQTKDNYSSNITGDKGWAAQRNYGRYYYENAERFVTEAGDWYYDEAIDKLWYWIREGEVPNDTMVTEIPAVTTLLSVEGTQASVPAFAGDFSLGVWFRATSGSIPDNFDRVTIFGTRNDNSATGWELALRTTIDQPTPGNGFSAYLNFVHANTHVNWLDNGDLDDDSWHHVVASVDKTENTVEIYLDGTSIGSNSIPTDDFLTVGPSIGGGPTSWNGELNDVVVLDKKTTTDTDAGHIMNGTYGAHSLSPTVVFNMPLAGDYETNCATITGVGYEWVTTFDLYSNPTFIDGGTGHNPCLSLDGVRDHVQTAMYPGVQVQNINFHNLTIVGVDRLPLTDSWTGDMADYEEKIPGAIELEYAKDCQVVGCTIRDCAGSGVFSKISENLTVSSNTIHDIGYNAIAFRVFNANDNSHDTRFVKEKKWEGHIVNENTIYNIGQVHANSSGIVFHATSRSTANRNLIYDIPYIGIKTNLSFDAMDRNYRDLEFAYNRIRNCMQVLNDGGAIAVQGGVTDCTIHHNNLQDCVRTSHHAFGRSDLTAPFGSHRTIHMDPGGGWSVTFNLINRCVDGINIHNCGWLTVIENNIVIDPEATGESACFVLNNHKQVLYTEEPIQQERFGYPVTIRYNIWYSDTGDEAMFLETATSVSDKTAIYAQTKDGSDGYNEIDFNLYSHDKVLVRLNNLGETVAYDIAYLRSLRDDTDHPPGNYAGLEIETNSVVDDPLFVDYDNGNFNVQAGSPALALGFINFDVPAF